MMIISLIVSSSLAVKAMELDKLDIETNRDYSLNQTIEQLKREYPEFLKLIPEDNHEQIVKILQEKRPNLVNYIMSKEGSITDEELIKQYGNDASNYFKSYISFGSAFLDVMNDPKYQEKAKEMQEKKQVQLAVLCNTLDKCITSIDKKKRDKKTEKDDNLKKITEHLEEKKSQFFVESSNTKELLKDALCSQYGALYRAIPQGHDVLVLECFIDKYPTLASTIINQKSKKNKGHSRTKSVINVEVVQSVILQNIEPLNKLYEKYKVLKALLESTGLNVDAIQTAVNKDLQLIVDGVVEKTKELHLAMTKKLEKCCIIN